MNVRSAISVVPRRDLSLNREILPRRVALQGPIDSFEPAAPVIQRAPATAVPATSSSSGGFFSNLWSSVKNVFSGLLGKAKDYVSNNLSGWVTKAQNFLGGLMGMAATWLQGWLTKLQNKLA
jgi:hypothetical protein